MNEKLVLAAKHFADEVVDMRRIDQVEKSSGVLPETPASPS